MNKNKKHIDKIFNEGLKDLRWMVSDADFKAIHKKSEPFNDPKTSNEKNIFDDFELPASDLDWVATKAKLDIEKNKLNPALEPLSHLSDLQIQPNPNDWEITYQKYLNERNKKSLFYWLSRVGGFIGLLLLLASTYLLLQKNDSPAKVQTISKQSEVDAPIASQNQSNHNSTVNKVPEKAQEGIQIPKQNSIPNANIIAAQSANQNGEISQTIRTSNGYDLPKLLYNDDVTFKLIPNTKVDENHLSPVFQVEDNLRDDELNNDYSFIQQEFQTRLSQDFINILLRSLANISNMNLGAINEKAIVVAIDTTKNPIEKSVFRLGLVNKVDYSHRLLSNKNPGFYNSVRKSSDKAQVRYTIGIELNKTSNKLQLSTGLNYSSYQFQSDYNYKYRVYDSIPVKDPGGVVIGYFLSRGRDTAIVENQKIRIQQLQVPLQVKYNFYESNRLKFYAGIGTVLSMNLSTRGNKMINPLNNQLYPYKSFETMERKFNIAPQLSLDMAYKFNKNWSFATGLSGSVNTLTRMKPSFNAQERIYSFGLDFKLMRTINWK